MKVKILGYRGVIIFDPINPIVADENFIPAGGGNLGNIIRNPEKNLGISNEALDLLKQIKPGRDAVGDLMWDENIFGWFGTPKNLKLPSQSVGDRDYVVGTKFITIENEVPEEVKEIIDQHFDSKK